MKDRDKLVEENLNLVHFTINKYYANKNTYCDYDDMFQAGCMGLLKAAEDYDESKQIKFSTYAVCIIKFYIQTHLIKEFKPEEDVSEKIDKTKKDEDSLNYQFDLENTDLCIEFLNNSNLTNAEKNVIILNFGINEQVITKLNDYIPMQLKDFKSQNMSKILNRAIMKIQIQQRISQNYIERGL